MKRYLIIAALTLSAVAAAKSDCKADCAASKTACVNACRENGKTKKSAADCIKRMCDMVVQTCEGQCNGKKK